MQATVGQPLVATLVDPAGDIEYLGARVEVPVTRAIVSFWQEAILVGATWTVTLETPVDPGDYLLVWRTGDPEPPEYETFIPLTVVLPGIEAPVVFPLVTVEDIKPTVEEIASLESTRTTAGGGGDVREFTDTTRPSIEEVEELIEQAAPAVLSQLGETHFSDAHFDRARHATSLYTSLLIEGSYFREELDRGSADLWRTLFNSTIVSLQDSIERELKQARILGRMEPRALA